MNDRERLIVALDVPTFDEMEEIVRAIGDEVATYKVGHQLFTAAGPRVISYLKAQGKAVFLDLKLHEIPNSAAAAVTAAGRQGVDMVTVHAAGGKNMMRAAVEAAVPFPGLKILALTVVTGLDDGALAEVGVPGGTEAQVDRLARLAQASGCQGVIASPLEVARLHTILGDDLLIVTAGVRPAGAAPGDQQRVGTPGQAIQAGAAYIVVGRPVVRANSPAAAAREIIAEIQRGRGQP